MYQETAGSGDGQMYQDTGTGRMYQDTSQVSADSLWLSIVCLVRSCIMQAQSKPKILTIAHIML